MSMILTLKGHTSNLSINFTPALYLDPNFDYGLALLSFHSYNSIPNIEIDQKFYLYENNDPTKDLVIEFPEGAYEIEDIEKYIRRALKLDRNPNADKIFSLKPNNNTLKCEIFSEKYAVDFRPVDSIGRTLGFSKKLLLQNDLHKSDLPVNIIKVRTVHLDSNITVGAFYNDRPSHTIYEFPITVDPGFAIDETPTHLIYLPIVNRRQINNITVNILDQNFEPVNFRGEEIIVRLEIRKLM